LRLPFGVLVAYAALALPLALAEIPIIVYLPAFYAQERHLNPGLLGLVFLLARLWDGASDLLIGWLCDRGGRKIWVLCAAPVLVASLWFLCNPPDDAGLGYLGVCTLIFYPAWTAIKIPYVSWGTELTCDYVERSRVTTYRETFTMLGNLLFAAAPLIFLAQNAPLQRVLLLMSVVVLLTVPVAVVPLCWRVPEPSPTRGALGSFLTGLRALTADKVLLRLVLATLLIWTSEGVINSLAVFSFGVGLRIPDRLFLVILVLYLATLGAVPLTLRLARHLEKHRLLAMGMAVYTLSTLVLIWAPAAHVYAIVGIWVVAGVGYACVTVLPTSVLADVVDNGEALTGERRAGAYAACYYLVVKIGLALGVGLSFGLLQWVHFDPARPVHGPADQFNIRLLGFGLPSLLYAGAVLLYWWHPISRARQLQLRARIEARALRA